MAERGKTLPQKLITARFLSGKERDLPVRITIPLAVSKKAVVRNKIKRRTRAILKDEGLGKITGLSLFFKKGSDALKFAELREELIKIIKPTK